MFYNILSLKLYEVWTFIRQNTKRMHKVKKKYFKSIVKFHIENLIFFVDAMTI